MSELIPQAPSAPRLLALLIEQYKNAVNLKKLIEIESEGLDAIETIALDLDDSFGLATATGDQLDCIGALWNVPRGVLSDTDYRARIYGVSFQGSTVTPDDLVHLFMASYGASYVEYFKETTACFFIRLVNPTTPLPQHQLEKYCGAGVLGIVGTELVDYNGDFIQDYNGNNILVGVPQT